MSFNDKGFVPLSSNHKPAMAVVVGGKVVPLSGQLDPITGEVSLSVAVDADIGDVNVEVDVGIPKQYNVGSIPDGSKVGAVTLPAGVKSVLISNNGGFPVQVFFDSETAYITIPSSKDSSGNIVIYGTLSFSTKATSVDFQSSGGIGAVEMLISHEA